MLSSIKYKKMHIIINIIAYKKTSLYKTLYFMTNESKKFV